MHHHRQHPIMSYGTISTSPGTITDLRLTPVVTYTTKEAIQSYGPQKRRCYTDEEIELTYLPKYLGYTYSYTNCLFESTYERVINECYCEIRNHAKVANTVYNYYSYMKPKRMPICIANQVKCANEIFSQISENMMVYDMKDQKKKECLPSCTDQDNHISYSKTNYPARLIPMFEDFCLLFVKLMTQCKQPSKRLVLNESYPTLCVGISAMENEFNIQKKKIQDEIRAKGPAENKKKDEVKAKGPSKDKRTDKVRAKGISNLSRPPSRNLWVSRYCDADVSAWTSLLENYTDSKQFENEIRKYIISTFSVNYNTNTLKTFFAYNYKNRLLFSRSSGLLYPF